MTLSTMEPNPVWDATAHEDTVDALSELGADATVRVWGADWCGDCRSTLPDLAAALQASEIPDENVHVHDVDREKDGELVEEYGVEYIPTVVVEVDGEEVARFVESEAVGPAVYLADQLE
jgi:thiol-disulfide isomerase/thioredoxin